MNNEDDDFLELDADMKAWEDAIASRDDVALIRLQEQAERAGQSQRIMQERLLNQAIEAWKEQTPRAPGSSELWASQIWERLNQEETTVTRRTHRAGYSIVSLLAACLCLMIMVIVWQKTDNGPGPVAQNQVEVPVTIPVQPMPDDEDLSSLLVEASESWSSLMNETTSSVTGSGAVLKEAVGEGLSAPELRLEGMVPAPFRKLFDSPKKTTESSLWQDLMGS